MQIINYVANNKVRLLFLIAMIGLSGCIGGEVSQEPSSPSTTPTSEPSQPFPGDQQSEMSTTEPVQAKVSRFKVWRDPTEDAFYGLIPEGWSAQGEVARPYLDATLQFEARADAQEIKSFFFFSPLPLAFMEPNSVLSMYGNTEGTWYEVPYTSYRYYVWRYLPGGEYVKSYLLPDLQKQFPDARIEKIVNRPDLGEVYQGYAATEQYDAADAVITYTKDGTKLKAGYTILTRRLYVPMGMGADFGIWGVYMMGCQGPEDEFEEVQSLYSSLMPTFRVNPEWMSKEIAAQRQRQQIISSTMQRIMENDYRMWKEESESTMRIARGWMNTLGGTETVKDQYGETYTVPTGPGMNHYWIDRAGNIVATELDEQPDIGFERMDVVR